MNDIETTGSGCESERRRVIPELSTNLLRPLGPTALSPFATSPEEGLETIFGFSSFRKGQRSVVEHLATGRDALVVMPTGSGKSLCYQLAGALTQGLTLVVSPLIALMKDQVDGLRNTGLPVTAIHSAIPRAEQRERIEGMYLGDYKVVYVAPERFQSRIFCEALEDVEIGLLVVDEAHCISQWGHDFRPAYRRLAAAKERFGDPQTVALTATATEAVRRDIREQLGIEQEDEIVAGLERPNLSFDVFHAGKNDDKIRRMKKLIDRYDGESIIVYCATRKQVISVQKKLEKASVNAGTYHGGMASGARREIQERWMTSELPVLVATNAFGMGVDKPDVRGVIHFNIPGSVEAYYQEAGRAGRDGGPAHCLLLFNRSDLRVHHWFAENTFPLRMQVIRIWLHLCSLGPGEHKITPAGLAKAARGPGQKLPAQMAQASLDHLSRGGHIRYGGGTVEVLHEVGPLDLNIDFDRFGERRITAKRQLGQITDYTRTQRCYQATLLAHFDDSLSGGHRCGCCGHCTDSITESAADRR